MTIIKICGITNIDDAAMCVRHGADELGFNFYPRSPRYISPETAAAIVEQLPASISTAGVFVNESAETIRNIAKTTGIQRIQLHGDESEALTSEIENAAGLEVIKAFRVGPMFSMRDVAAFRAGAILLDAYSPSDHGGTGKVFDWQIAADLKRLVPKLYLAGGLSPENVAEAVKQVGPFAVDSCSLLESSPGLKDPRKVKHFIKAVRDRI